MTKTKTRSGSISIISLKKLAFKNLLRNKGRNFILIGMIALGLTAYIALDSLYTGIYVQGSLNLMRYQTGEYQLQHDLYWENEQEKIEGLFPVSAKLEQELEKEGWSASKRVKVLTEVVFPSPPFATSGSIFFGLLGVSSGDPYIQQFSRDNEGSRDLSFEGAWVSKWFVRQTGAKIGDPLVFICKGNGGFLEQLNVTIEGIYSTPNPRQDRYSILLSYDFLNDYLRLNNQYNEVNLYRTASLKENQLLSSPLGGIEKKPIEAESLSRIVRGSHANVDAHFWEDIEKKRYNFGWKVPRAVSFIFTTLILIIAATGLINITSINIDSRRKEIGTLYSFGLTRSKMYFLFITEAAYIGFMAALLGALMGMGVMYFFVNHGLNYSVFFEESDWGMPFDGYIYGMWRLDTYFIALIVGILFTVLVTFFTLLFINKRYTQITQLLRVTT